LLVIINALLLVGCAEGALAGHSFFGAAYLLMLSAALFSNGCWHVWASYKSHAYSPGMITGSLIYIPMGVFEYVKLLQLRQVGMGTAAAALLVGGSYPLWSAVYHKRSIEPAS
jgi:hypothetical protein